MGDGKLVLSDSQEDRWEPVAPGSTIEGLWKVAYGK